jgi:DNA modification methylase
MRKLKGIVSDCISDTKTSQIKPKSAKETKNETKELIISGEEVNSNNNLCSPCNYEGMNRIDLDREVKWVKTTDLKPSSHHIQIYSEEKILDNALIKSIKKKGIITPLLITSTHIIISGVRRFKVALLLNMELVPVIYNTNDELNVADIVDSNITRIKKYSIIYKEYKVLKKAYGISQGTRTDLVHKGKKSQEKINTILGVSRGTIARLIKIERLASQLFNSDTHKLNEIWDMVDQPKKGIMGVLRYLNNIKYERNNSNGVVENLIGNGYTIYNSSSAKMNELEDNSVNLHITSPPYWGGIRNYNLGENELGWENNVDDYVSNLVEHFEATRRVLKPTGSLVVNIADSIDKSKNHLSLAPMRFVIKMIEKGWHLAGTYIWLKSRFIPTPNKKTPISTFENIFHFTKTPNYSFYKEWMYNDTDPIFNPLIFGKSNKSKCIKDVFDLREMNEGGVINWLVSNTTELDKKCKERGIEQNHNATFPLMIPSVFINLTTKPGDLVIDGFNGTASTGAASQVLGRNYIGFELNKNYISVSKVRIESIEEELNGQMAA